MQLIHDLISRLCANLSIFYNIREYVDFNTCINRNDVNDGIVFKTYDQFLRAVAKATGEAPLQVGESTPGCSNSGLSSEYVGCYADRAARNRALPFQIPGRKYTAAECEYECAQEGFVYFGREWKGQCFCGDQGYDRYGSETGCDCCGEDVGPRKLCVWENGL